MNLRCQCKIKHLNHMTTLISSSATTSTLANNPEIDLLLSCSRTQLNNLHRDRIKSLLRQNINWDYLMETAQRHKVMTLLYQSLKATCPEAVPQTTLKQLRFLFQVNYLRNQFLTEELLKLLTLFEKSNISAVPFKGPVLAVKAYGNLALRQFSDLDILIHKRDIFRVKELLLFQGYQLASHIPPTDIYKLMHLRAACEYNFFNKERCVTVEPHWDFTQRKLCISLNLESLWQNLKEISLDGKTVPTFSLEDSLLIVCINGTKDHWRTLKHICDVAELIRSHQEIDWDRLIQQTRITGCKRILLLGLFLANDILGANLPEKIWKHIETDLALKDLVLQVNKRLFDSTTRPSKHFGGNFSLWDIQVRERLLDKVWYCSNLVFGPNEGDADFLPLPDYLAWIYPFIRPFRLASRFALSLLR